MARRRPVDLSAHINRTVEAGHPADFPVALRPVLVYNPGNQECKTIPSRLAVMREDTGQVLSVVSERYTLVRHQELLHTVEEAIGRLDVGAVPRGIYVDRDGARMRALFKFPALADTIYRGDEICPCIKIQNTYDGTSRIVVHIGAFRFVCTNLAVGGGGIFAGGFMAVHAGEIDINRVAEQLGSFLSDFSRIVETYRTWSNQLYDRDRLATLLEELPKRAATKIGGIISSSGVESVWSAYNVATYHATHQMRSVRTAFDLLELINRGFQRYFPVRETAACDNGPGEIPRAGLVMFRGNGDPKSRRRFHIVLRLSDSAASRGVFRVRNWYLYYVDILLTTWWRCTKCTRSWCCMCSLLARTMRCAKEIAEV